MFHVGCRYIFTKYPAERITKVLATQPRGKRGQLCPRRELNDDPVSSPMKLAYLSYESTVPNKSIKPTDASPIIIVHGLFGSKKNWNSLSKIINQRTGRKVIAADLRNHGDSPHSPDMAFPDMAKDMERLVKDLGNEKAVIIGHSMGGTAVMYFALEYPEFVSKLVVIDMSPISTSPSAQSMRNLFRAMKNVTLDQNVPFSEASRTADQQLSTFIKSATIRQHLLENLVEIEPGKYKWCLNSPVLEKHFDTVCVFPHIVNKTFSGPTLFVGGDLSNFLPLNDHEKIKELFPAVKFAYIPGAGHWVHTEKPEEFVNTIVPFINDESK